MWGALPRPGLYITASARLSTALEHPLNLGSSTPALVSGAVLVVDNQAEEPSGNLSFCRPATESASLTSLIQHHINETGSGINGGEN